MGRPDPRGRLWLPHQGAGFSLRSSPPPCGDSVAAAAPRPLVTRGGTCRLIGFWGWCPPTPGSGDRGHPTRPEVGSAEDRGGLLSTENVDDGARRWMNLCTSDGLQVPRSEAGPTGWGFLPEDCSDFTCQLPIEGAPHPCTSDSLSSDALSHVLSGASRPGLCEDRCPAVPADTCPLRPSRSLSPGLWVVVASHLGRSRAQRPI